MLTALLSACRDCAWFVPSGGLCAGLMRQLQSEDVQEREVARLVIDELYRRDRHGHPFARDQLWTGALVHGLCESDGMGAGVGVGVGAGKGEARARAGAGIIASDAAWTRSRCELLTLMLPAIRGFAVPLRRRHRSFFLRVVLPLHFSPAFPELARTLVPCVVAFLRKVSICLLLNISVYIHTVSSVKVSLY